jgi:hypothetical protein
MKYTEILNVLRLFPAQIGLVPQFSSEGTNYVQVQFQVHIALVCWHGIIAAYACQVSALMDCDLFSLSCRLLSQIARMIRGKYHCLKPTLFNYLPQQIKR